jgi:hypothetical protein
MNALSHRRWDADVASLAGRCTRSRRLAALVMQRRQRADTGRHVDRRILMITHQLQRGPEGLALCPPKTRRTARLVTLDSATVGLLRRHPRPRRRQRPEDRADHARAFQHRAHRRHLHQRATHPGVPGRGEHRPPGSSGPSGNHAEVLPASAGVEVFGDVGHQAVLADGDDDVLPTYSYSCIQGRQTGVRRRCQVAAPAAVRETGLMWANMLRAFQVGKARTSHEGP